MCEGLQFRISVVVHMKSFDILWVGLITSRSRIDMNIAMR